VRLQVADITRSIAYYEQVLGLRVVARGPAGGDAPTATLAAQGDDAPLIVLRERRGARPVPRRGRLGLFHFAILLPDRPALGRFVTHLGEIGAQAGMSDHFVSEAIYLYDPDGLGIEIYADRPRSAWRTDGRQLYMTTEPLDVRSLVATAGGDRWTGMPAGTVMGHVHLHVGDIDAADAFYHQTLGFDKVVWTYPGALFMSAGGYHHHLGTNTWAAGAPPATDDDARLLDWRIIVPDDGTVAAVAESLTRAGHPAEHEGSALRTRDPWGTAVRITADGA
jgi:catechol 2,3-dioxygenase